MDLLDFVMLFLATGALVNAWMHKDGIFEGLRDAISAWGEPRHETPTLRDKMRNSSARLLNCRVCLTYHAAFWLIVLFYVPSHLWLSPPWATIWRLPVWALAATRLSLLVGTFTACLPIEDDPEND